MIVSLIKLKQMFDLTLPLKIKGQYWISDIDDMGKQRDLISVEAVLGEWVVKSNKLVSILDVEGSFLQSIILKPLSYFNLKIANSDERVILFVENIDLSRQIFTKYVASSAALFRIGRAGDSDLYYGNKFVSGKHAQLSYDGSDWSVTDTDSKNGTYINGFRVETQKLKAGDLIYIMGLKIVVGHNYLSVNNPDGLLKNNSDSLLEYHPQEAAENTERDIELPPKRYFYRSPRFYKERKSVNIKIDSPPQRQKNDTVPMALMLGPSITMGMTSLSTGLLTLNNVISKGGDTAQALPTLLMSGSMLLGTVLWPILTKKYEKKMSIKSEQKRQEKYLAYLDEIRDEIRRISKEQRDILTGNLISLEDCEDRIAEEKASLWERAIGQSDFLRLRLGIGNLPLEADIKHAEKKFTMDDDNLQDAMLSLGAEVKQLINVPISVSLTEDNVIGIFGKGNSTAKMVKALILQMITLHSYDELKLMLVTDEHSNNEWDFVRWIPHFWNNDKTVRFYAADTDELKELSVFINSNILLRKDAGNQEYTEHTPYYVIFLTSKKMGEKCEALRQLLELKSNVGFSVITVADELKDLPKETKLVISAEEEESRVFDKNDIMGRGTTFSADEVNEASIENLAKDIANIELDLSSQNYSLPNMLTFLEMFHVSKMEHLNSLTRWKENNPTITLQTPIGIDTAGEAFYLDLHEKFHGPHGLVAGMTGSGKSEFIITYILSMAVNYHPDEVSFILIDFKGDGLAGAFMDEEHKIKLPHLSGTITNLDGGVTIKRSLISIQSELRRRQNIFKDTKKISNEGTMDIYKYQQLYRDKVVSEPLPHLLIISDEFAELKSQQPEFMEQLISAARIGRSLGIHLILATQKPSGVVDDQIWSNSKFRVCLKVQEKADSQEMIKCSDAAELSQTGRFYLQVGYNELFALGQSAWCGAEYTPKETVEKSIDSSVQVINHLGRVLMNVKPDKKTMISDNKMTQIVAAVKYLSDLAAEEKIMIKPLWLEPIPANIFVENIEKKYSIQVEQMKLNPVVGEYDDPSNQKQDALTIPFTEEGNCLVYGSTGNGKTTFLTTLCYALIRNHSAQEVNVYIMDFGSETLKVFENAPQVGGVTISSEEEKTVNLIKMLSKELGLRKRLFSDFGGDHESYCRNSGKSIPNIMVILNNYSGFTEQYEDLMEAFNVLTRDGVKYGIYFAVTASSTNTVSYRVAQNFKIILTMQLNDETDYSLAVGKTGGLLPSRMKGRGLVALDQVYEFQTAYCKDVPDKLEYLRSYCAGLRLQSQTVARKIPLLPSVVKYDHVREYIRDLKTLPVGIGKKSLQIASVNMLNKVLFPVAMREIYQITPFAEELVTVTSGMAEVVVIDAEQLLSEDISDRCVVITKDFELCIRELFTDMVARNNSYKDANMDQSMLDRFPEKLYIVIGLKRFYDQLSGDGKDKMNTLLDKAEAFYKLRFIVADSLMQLNLFSNEAWYKRHITGSEGIWIGDGIADQYLLRVNKISSDLYEEVGDDYGYLLERNRPTLIKLLSSRREEDD